MPGDDDTKGTVTEFVRGVSNTFIIEPRKASGDVVRDITVSSEFAGQDAFFVELWNSDPSIVDGNHDWYADGGVAAYNPSVYEVQRVNKPSTGDDFSLIFTFNGVDYTTELVPGNVSSVDLQIALEDLDAIDTVIVNEDGTSGDSWLITFTSNLGDLQLLSSSNNGILISEEVKGITEIQSIFNVATEECTAEVQMIRAAESTTCGNDFDFDVTFDGSDLITLNSKMTNAEVNPYLYIFSFVTVHADYLSWQ